jgi:cell division protease FtsH
VRSILDRNYERAKEIIERNRDNLVRLVEQLMKLETLDRDEFEGVMNEESSSADQPVGALMPEV